MPMNEFAAVIKKRFVLTQWRSTQTASWRLGLNQCIMLGSRVVGDLTEKCLRDRTRRWSSTQDHRQEGVNNDHTLHASTSFRLDASMRTTATRFNYIIVLSSSSASTRSQAHS